MAAYTRPRISTSGFMLPLAKNFLVFLREVFSLQAFEDLSLMRLVGVKKTTFLRNPAGERKTIVSLRYGASKSFGSECRIDILIAIAGGFYEAEKATRTFRLVEVVVELILHVVKHATAKARQSRTHVPFEKI